MKPSLFLVQNLGIRLVRHFQPIVLCNVTYKCVLKVLANRLKLALPSCIGHSQSTFVLGRMIHDNGIVAHKLIHYLQSLKNEMNKMSVLKLDISKTYDRVE